MSKDNYEEKYTDPGLRRRLKEEIKQSDKGGDPGEWSARKSQLLVQEYEKHGGGYKHKEKDESQRSLEEWGEEDWQTREGDARARHDGKTERYLPKEVWDKLSEKEKDEAERTKERASKKGEQHVDWTPAVRRAMDDYEREQHKGGADGDQDHAPSKRELDERAKELGISGRSTMNKEELARAVNEAEHS